MASLRMFSKRRQSEDVEAKSRLAKDTFHEVLDATKHQDDKIGRLMTAMAFLTAAALALANLGQAKYLAATFDVAPPLKLGLIAIGAFGVLVVLAVILLLMALGTPLNLTRDVPDEDAKKLDPSELYFFEIGTFSKEHWEAAWEQANSTDLQKARLKTLVRDIHHLSIRSTFKYDLRAEATMILSLALLALTLAFLFITFAAADPPGRLVSLHAWHRLLLALTFASFSVFQVSARLRHPARRPSSKTTSEKNGIPMRHFLWAIPPMIGLVVLYPQPWLPIGAWIVLMAGMTCIAVIGVLSISRKPWRRRANLLITIVLALSGALAVLRPAYVAQLVVAVLSVLVVGFVTTLLPVLHTRRQR